MRHFEPLSQTDVLPAVRMRGPGRPHPLSVITNRVDDWLLPYMIPDPYFFRRSLQVCSADFRDAVGVLGWRRFLQPPKRAQKMRPMSAGIDRSEARCSSNPVNYLYCNHFPDLRRGSDFLVPFGGGVYRMPLGRFIAICFSAVSWKDSFGRGARLSRLVQDAEGARCRRRSTKGCGASCRTAASG